MKQWSSLFPQFDTWYVLFKQIIWPPLLYSLRPGQEGVCGILQCHLGLKRSSTSEPRGHTTWSPYTVPGTAPLSSGPISSPPNKSWSTKWHWANKAPFQKRLQLQQETLWLWVCLKCYQYHDHSCGSTKPSLITISWLHLQLCINLQEEKKKKRSKLGSRIEERLVQQEARAMTKRFLSQRWSPTCTQIRSDIHLGCQAVTHTQ